MTDPKIIYEISPKTYLEIKLKKIGICFRMLRFYPEFDRPNIQ